MPVTFKIDGEVWEFSTAAEAAEFKRSLSVQTRAPQPAPPQPATRRRQRGRPSGRGSREIATVRARRVQAVVNKATLSAGSRALLEAVRRIPAGGLRSEEFARAIGVSGPTSIPVKMMVLGKELKALGLKPEEVVLRDRIYVKGRGKSVFKPGPRLDDALKHTGDLFAVAR